MATRKPTLATLAARALRAIPSEARSEQSRSNGARGGRLPGIVHVTRVTPTGEVYGHAARHCDESGCSAFERYFGRPGEAVAEHLYQLDRGKIVAEIVD